MPEHQQFSEEKEETYPMGLGYGMHTHEEMYCYCEQGKQNIQQGKYYYNYSSVLDTTTKIELGMKRCVGELEQKGSQRVEQIREYSDGLGMWKEWMITVWPEGC